jgi:hypothetical protein
MMSRFAEKDGISMKNTIDLLQNFIKAGYEILINRSEMKDLVVDGKGFFKLLLQSNNKSYDTGQ